MYWHKCCSIAIEPLEKGFLSWHETRKTLSFTTWVSIVYGDKDGVQPALFFMHSSLNNGAEHHIWRFNNYSKIKRIVYLRYP